MTDVDDGLFESVELRWKIINKLIEAKWSGDDHFISFAIDEEKKYSERKIKNLINDRVHAYSDFSNLIHQMPDTKNFYLSSDRLLWKEYQKIFFCATIAKQNDNELFNELEIDREIRNKYKIFESEYLELENEYVEEINEGKSKERIDSLINKISNKNKEWILNGYKRLVDEKRDQAYGEGEFSYASQWSKWKLLAEKSWAADSRGPNSITGVYQADFESLLDDSWLDASFTHKQMKFLLKSSFDENWILKKIDGVKFKHKTIVLKRDWFSQDVFLSDFWNWKPTYNGEKLSDGNLSGNMPSFIEKVIFIKDICFRERSNIILDFIEWIGGGLSELEYIPFIENNKGDIFLTAFSCKKIPECPRPNSELIF